MSDLWECDCREDAVFTTEEEYDLHLESHEHED